MNPPRVFVCVLVWLSVANSSVFALPMDGKIRIDSPGNRFSLYLTDTAEEWIYKLHIRKGNKTITTYTFSGAMMSAYWSPNFRYVVINNHDGHFGWWLWIISLSDGAVITRDGPCHDPNYDRYSEVHDYGPDIFSIMEKQIARLDKNYKKYNLREGYLSIAYGWTENGDLKMFYEFPFDDLKDSIIYGYSLDKIKHGRVKVVRTWTKLCDDRGEDGIPDEAKSTLNF